MADLFPIDEDAALGEVSLDGEAVDVESVFGEDTPPLDSEDEDGDALFQGESIEASSDLPVYRLYLPYAHEMVSGTFRGDLFKAGDYVIIPTKYGRDIALVKKMCPPGHPAERAVWIERGANDADIARMKENAALEKDAFSICREKISNHGLDMKLVTAHYLFDEPKIIFFFSAESRVDFRELVKDLVSVFHLRIELRQIGIREEARIAGGLGHCGREFCCHALCDRMKPVSIKMAKEQGLSLNSLKISGQCGRLLCCLAFEYNFYAENRKFLPPEGCRLSYHNALWRVTESNVIMGRVTLSGEDGQTVSLPKSQFERVDNRWTVKPDSEAPLPE